MKIMNIILANLLMVKNKEKELYYIKMETLNMKAILLMEKKKVKENMYLKTVHIILVNG